jgi:hypothetical protein
MKLPAYIYLFLANSPKQDNADRTLSYEVDSKKHTNILKFIGEKAKRSVKVLTAVISFLRKDDRPDKERHFISQRMALFIRKRYAKDMNLENENAKTVEKFKRAQLSAGRQIILGSAGWELCRWKHMTFTFSTKETL